MNISSVMFEKLKKMLKIADFAKFGPKYLGPQIFKLPDMGFVAVNSKYSLVSRISELRIFIEAPKHEPKLQLFSSFRSRGCQPTPYYFLFSKCFGIVVGRKEARQRQVEKNSHTPFRPAMRYFDNFYMSNYGVNRKTSFLEEMKKNC